MIFSYNPTRSMKLLLPRETLIKISLVNYGGLELEEVGPCEIINPFLGPVTLLLKGDRGLGRNVSW